jgi:RNA-directed DNA polymerase
LKRTYPDLLWCRYDGVVHCRTEQEAEALKADLQARLAECQLEVHPVKTRIVYCKDKKRNAEYPNVTLDFLGYCFRPRLVKNTRNRQLFCGFNPAISPAALKDIRSTIKSLKIRRQTDLTLEEIARRLNPLLRGWIEYYGRFTPSALEPLYRHVNSTLLRWVRRKYKRFAAHPIQAGRFLEQLARTPDAVFVHGRLANKITPSKKSTMNYRSFAYSTLACFSAGMSGSASFHNSRKSWYAALAFSVSPASAEPRAVPR